MPSRRSTLLLACSISLAAAANAQTTTLPFDGVNASTLNDNGYGDRVDGPISGGFSYNGVGTYTPNVVATFGSTDSGGAEPMFTWGTGYNDLINVIYAAVGGLSGSGDEIVITLAADPGYGVSIDAFDVGNWGPAIVVPYVRIFDEDGALLFEDLSVALNVSTSPIEQNYVLAPAPRGRVLHLVIGLDGLAGNADNVGVDNLTFSQFTTPANEIGNAYCTPGAVNSTSGPSLLRAWGSEVVADNDVRLFAWGLPIGSFGFFITSRMQGFVANPAGSQGNLCVSGAIGRYVGPGQIRNSGPTGTYDLELDLTMMPTPTGLVPAAAGETWNFQAWHRDFTGMTTSNFTPGLAITLQ